MKNDIVNIIFGDSIAYGLGDDKHFGWFNRLRIKNDLKLKQFYFNLSIPGQGSTEILKRFDTEFKARFNNEDKFNLIFAFGIKDALKLGSDKEYIKVFEPNVISLISLAKKYTTNIFFLGLMDVDIALRNEYSENDIKQINVLLEKVCQKNDVAFINMSGIVNKNDLFDGLHPNEVGHKKISDYIYDSIFKGR